MRIDIMTPARFSLDEIERATQIVREVVPPTPQQRWPLLEARVGAEVWVKHENQTCVGAFKIRGGLVYFHELHASGEKTRGVVAATRGNHGQAVGFAARRHGIPAAVVAPKGNSKEKNAAMRALGVELIEQGADFQESLEFAQALAAERGWHRIPSFHPWLALGAATGALELLRGAPPLDTVYVPVGLGSGICGMVAARDALGLETKVVGVCSSRARTYAMSFAARRAISSPVTTEIADGMACRTPVEEALAIMYEGVSRIVEVSDAQVADAMRAYFSDTHNVAEGAGGAALAALLGEGEAMRGGKRVGLVLSGGNVDRDVYAKVLSGWSPAE